MSYNYSKFRNSKAGRRTFPRRSSRFSSRRMALSAPMRRRFRTTAVTGYTDNLLKGVDYSWLRDTSPFSPIVILNTSTAVGVVPVNVITQGTGFYERLGRKISMKSLQIFGQLRVAAPLGINPQVVNIRMAVVYDRQPNGAIPSFNTIFSAVTTAGEIGAATVMAPVNLTQTSRFRILRDKTWSLQPQRGLNVVDDNGIIPEADYAGYQGRQVREYIKLPSLETVYNSSASPPTIDQIATGALYIVFRATPVTSSLAETPIEAHFDNANVRLRYVDV